MAPEFAVLYPISTSFFYGALFWYSLFTWFFTGIMWDSESTWCDVIPKMGFFAGNFALWKLEFRRNYVSRLNRSACLVVRIIEKVIHRTFKPFTNLSCPIIALERNSSSWYYEEFAAFCMGKANVRKDYPSYHALDHLGGTEEIRRRFLYLCASYSSSSYLCSNVAHLVRFTRN